MPNCVVVECSEGFVVVPLRHFRQFDERCEVSGPQQLLLSVPLLENC